MRAVALFAALFGAVGCASAPPPAEPAPPPPAKPAPAPPPELPALPGEAHFAGLRRLTFGGENAEAYWSFGGRELVLQAKVKGAACDRIYRLALDEPTPALVPVSSGRGATTCSYFLPGDKSIIFSSTEHASPECPPPPDRSQGYVWPLHEHDIYKVNHDGSGAVRLTETKGYDAESTVCQKDGSIIFTSVRDGDLELYRMDSSGKNVMRLTNAPGYDGGAYFSPDCSKIVWRASRPKDEKELADYKGLLEKGLVRPSKLEIYVANADGSEPVQVTYLDAASFGPSWHPSGKRIVFSSNYGDPKGREFDIWAIDVTGTNLERITHAPGFDGFPMFSPDGKSFAFSSNRMTPPGGHDTDVFVARWVEGSPNAIEAITATPGRLLGDIAYLADPAQEGRGIGTKGLERAGAYLEKRMKDLGLEPAGDAGSFRQSFPAVTALEVGPGTEVRVGTDALPKDAFVPLGFSPKSSKAEGDLVFAGYGVVVPKGRDDYAKLNVRGKIAVVRRFVPETSEFSSPDAKRRHGDLRFKAWLAKQRGAKALIVVDEPEAPKTAAPKTAAPKTEAPKTEAPKADPHKTGAPGGVEAWKKPDEARLPALAPEGHGDAGIPAVVIKRSAGAPFIEALEKGTRLRATVSVDLVQKAESAFNVVGRITASPEAGKKLPGTIVIGAHYDHLGFGGRHSLAPGDTKPHVGADDNASGTAAILEIARALMTPEARRALRRDVVVAAFPGEESGLLGSAHFVHAGEKKTPGALGPKDVYAMVNLDMVGRLRENKLQVLGGETAREWTELVEPACRAARVQCGIAGDGGYGPSDQMSFYVAGAPVLHLFTGSHADYHKPTDTTGKINAWGAAQIAEIVAKLTSALAVREKPLTYVAARGAAPRGDLRSFNASLGTIPDYAGPGPGKTGVLLSGVRPGGAADKAGLKRGDVLVRLGPNDIRSVEDLMYVLNESKPGETVKVVVLRAGKPVELEATFQESRPR
jgi:Tol biopolymer transport system component